MKSQALSMSGALRMKRLVRGRLACTNRSKGGAPFYCLQYTRKGRHVTKYVPSSEVAAYREATENCRRFMDAVDAYVEAASARTAEEPESREDFIHKMKLAMKELAETRCWLRILGASGCIDAKRLEPLIAESLELTRMMGASVSTARSRMG